MHIGETFCRPYFYYSHYAFSCQILRAFFFFSIFKTSEDLDENTAIEYMPEEQNSNARMTKNNSAKLYSKSNDGDAVKTAEQKMEELFSCNERLGNSQSFVSSTNTSNNSNSSLINLNSSCLLMGDDAHMTNTESGLSSQDEQ